MKHLVSTIALFGVFVLCACASAPSREGRAVDDIVGTWSGQVVATFPPNSAMQRQSESTRGGWTFYADGIVISSRGLTGRWRTHGDEVQIAWSTSAWGTTTRGPRRVNIDVVGATLSSTWTQTNLVHRERYQVSAELRRLAQPEICEPPAAPAQELRHAVLARTIEAGNEDIRDVRFSIDGRRLAVGSNDARVRVFDVASGRLLMQSPVTAGPIWNVVFARDDRRIVSFGPNGGAFGYYMWDPETGEGELTTDYDAFWNVSESQFPESRDNTRRYEGGVLFDRASSAVIAEMPGAHAVRSKARFSYDGSGLFVRRNYETSVFDGRTGAPISHLCRTSNGSNEIRVTANGAYAATQEYGPAFSPHVIAVWHVASGAVVARVRAPDGSIWAQDISSDAALLATGSRDGRVRIWRLAPGAGPIPLIEPTRSNVLPPLN